MNWQAVFKSADLSEGQRHIVEVDNKSVGIFRQNGRLYAVLNFCPHAGAPVCQGQITLPVRSEEVGVASRGENPVLRCPWHRWEFDLATGLALSGVSQRLKCFPIEERDGEIFLEV